MRTRMPYENFPCHAMLFHGIRALTAVSHHRSYKSKCSWSVEGILGGCFIGSSQNRSSTDVNTASACKSRNLAADVGVKRGQSEALCLFLSGHFRESLSALCFCVRSLSASGVFSNGSLSQAGSRSPSSQEVWHEDACRYPTCSRMDSVSSRRRNHHEIKQPSRD